MRLGVVTPWNGQSAIARVNHAVARELQERSVDVTIIRSECGESADLAPLTDEFLLVSGCDTPPLRVGYDLDAICYAIGNHFPFHGAGLQMLAEQPGIVLLHDFYLGDLAAGWEHSMRVPEGAERLRLLVYGESPSPEATLDWLVTHQPLVEWPASMATAAVVHADHYRQRVAAICPGPVTKLSLPGWEISLPEPSQREPGSALVLATVGDVNPNKLPDAVIRAIGSSPRLTRACTYRLIGSVEPEMRASLTKLASAFGVKLEMTGWLSEEQLRAELALADAILCLRRPIMEGASMSAIVGLLSARPTVVCNAGFYAEIPDDLVLKIPPKASQDAIIHSLEQLLDQPRHTLGRAARARSWALETFTASHYAEGLLQLIEESLEITLTVTLARRQHAQIQGWGLERDDPLYARIVQADEQLFRNEQ